MNFWQKTVYYLLIGLCKLVGFLPYRILYYGIVDVICFFIYNVAGYRVKVVRENLRNSFPEKTDEELLVIEKKFYKHLSEIFIDTATICALTCRKLKDRFVYENAGEIESAMAGRTWLCAMAHYGSWEYTINYKMYTGHSVAAVYKTLHDKIFDSFYSYIRSRCGAEPVAMENVGKVIVRNRRDGIPTAFALIGDQTPPEHAIHHWYRFLNQLTPFHMGIEKMALKFKLPVFFLEVKKIKRGYYTGRFVLLYDGMEDVPEMEITARYAAKLESMIKERPELWLWSHKRWKHKPRPGYKYKYQHGE